MVFLKIRSFVSRIFHFFFYTLKVQFIDVTISHKKCATDSEKCHAMVMYSELSGCFKFFHNTTTTTTTGNVCTVYVCELCPEHIYDDYQPVSQSVVYKCMYKYLSNCFMPRVSHKINTMRFFHASL